MALWNTKPDPVPVPADAAPAPIRHSEPLPPKDPPPAARRDEAVAPAPATSDLLLGPGAEFDGRLTFRGTVRIDAKFTGSIMTNDVLVVGEHARIDAEITCGTVVVHGEVNGNVRATNAVELRRTARLRGDVTAASIAVDKGAVLQGSVKMASADKVAKAS